MASETLPAIAGPASSPPFWKNQLRSSSARGLFIQTVQLFVKIRAASAPASSFGNTLSSVLKSCAALRLLSLGESLHAFAIRSGLARELYVSNSLLNLYSKAGSHVSLTRKLFDEMPERDIVSWNTLISSLAEQGMYGDSLCMVKKMGETGFKPDSFTLSTILPIFSEIADVSKGMEIHAFAIRNSLESNKFMGTGLIDMYAKCTRIDYSKRVFDLLPEPDDVAWNSVIAGCVQNGAINDAFRMFREMLKLNIRPMPITFSSVLPACAHLTALRLGRQMHCYAIRLGFDRNLFVLSAVIYMYSKCGNITVARRVFDLIDSPDLVSYTTMIMGYALNGPAGEALHLFREMERKERPNHVTFLAVLTACSHAGLVNQAMKYFDSMCKDYKFVPNLEHYATVADVLGRAGELNKAYDFISKMDIKPTASVWSTLLRACRVYKNTKLAEKVAGKIIELEPEDSGPHILMSNVYSAAGRWDEAAKLRAVMREKGIKKEPACSWIEIKGKVHAFGAHDELHPSYNEILREFRVLSEKMVSMGYVPNTEEVTQDIEDEHKRYVLCGHSERLAIVLGIINTPPGTTIRVIKNLRVCVDCHDVTKFISKIVEREIVVRDLNRFHHFKDGNCSCGDYW